MKLATLLVSIIPLLFLATNVEAHPVYKIGKAGDVPIRMPGPDDRDNNHVHPGHKPGHGDKPNPGQPDNKPRSAADVPMPPPSPPPPSPASAPLPPPSPPPPSPTSAPLPPPAPPPPSPMKEDVKEGN